jgi:serine/threonine-protein kinase RsbW
VAIEVVEEHRRVWEVTARVEELSCWRGEAVAVIREWEVATGAEDTVRLGVTELLVNVIKHVGDPRCRLELARVGATLTVTVHDRCARLPRPGRPDWEAASGRGLWLLEEMTDALGWFRSADGKQVWFRCAPVIRAGRPR